MHVPVRGISRPVASMRQTKQLPRLFSHIFYFSSLKILRNLGFSEILARPPCLASSDFRSWLRAWSVITFRRLTLPSNYRLHGIPACFQILVQNNVIYQNWTSLLRLLIMKASYCLLSFKTNASRIISVNSFTGFTFATQGKYLNLKFIHHA